MKQRNLRLLSSFFILYAIKVLPTGSSGNFDKLIANFKCTIKKPAANHILSYYTFM